MQSKGWHPMPVGGASGTLAPSPEGAAAPSVGADAPPSWPIVRTDGNGKCRATQVGAKTVKVPIEQSDYLISRP
jgi:hypothetical protein